MSRHRRTSVVLETTRQRVATDNSIIPAPDTLTELFCSKDGRPLPVH
jgi:hypothetical protein